jgi:periplasmic protein TonB
VLDLLPASSSHPEITPRSVLTAIAVHLLVIGLAIAATRSVLDATRVSPRREPIPLLIPRPTEPPTEPPAEPKLPRNRRVGPPPERFQHIPLPLEVPPVIPPIDLSRRPFDPSDLVWTRAERGPAGGETVQAHGSPDKTYGATTGLEGFEPAVLLTQPPPRYPGALLFAQVAGAVLLEFVVDTAGRVETGSVRVVESSHRGFEDAARVAVLGARFHPATLRGRPVRQLTRQQVRFVAEK